MIIQVPVINGVKQLQKVGLVITPVKPMYFRPCLKFKNHVSIPSVLGWSRPTNFKSRLASVACGWLVVCQGWKVGVSPTNQEGIPTNNEGIPTNKEVLLVLGGTPNWQDYLGSFPRSFAWSSWECWRLFDLPNLEEKREHLHWTEFLEVQKLMMSICWGNSWNIGN